MYFMSYTCLNVAPVAKPLPHLDMSLDQVVISICRAAIGVGVLIIKLVLVLQNIALLSLSLLPSYYS